MTYAGIQMFMEKLNHLINCYENPLFNNPTIICERPQLQLLYDELSSIVPTLFIHQHQDLHDLEKLRDLKKRFTDAAEEAEYIVDLFVSGVHIGNTTEDFPTSRDLKRFLHLDYVRRSIKSVVSQFLSCVHIRNNGHSPTSEDSNLNLDDVRRSLKSVEVEFLSMNIDQNKMDSSPIPQTTLNQSATAAQSSISRGSKKLMDEIFVGIDRDAELIRDKLVEDRKKLDVVSIVGMGGIGKTTLATKVFNDGYVNHHFHVRVWVTVSQTYDKRAVLTQILQSISGQPDLEDANDSRLRELVHKNLMGKRYLIVIDDIWHIETWDNLKVFFPHENNGSRILLTSRLDEVAKHANSDGLIHHLEYLNKEKGWELLCQKVFPGGVLAKHSWSKKFWKKIADRTGLYIVGDQNGCLETLALSYDHLPLHLRECFLYLGGFPEDYRLEVRELILLWVAEGFIEQDGNKRLEDIAEGYMMDLIDRNLVSEVHRSKSTGYVKACKVHDLVRELCLRKAKEERFILITERLLSSPQFSDVITQPNKPVRMFINKVINILGFPYSPAQNLRSILCYTDFRYLSNDMAMFLGSFGLLRVLNLQNLRLRHFPKGMRLLVHLRYLAIIWGSRTNFPDSICNLWNLQTLIYLEDVFGIDTRIYLPSNISDLVNLRHLKTNPGNGFVLPSIERPMKNLQTISRLELGDGVVDNFQKCIPYIKELKCDTDSDKQNDFQSLIYLEKLNLTSKYTRRVNTITFPATLKTLTLKRCGLAWRKMSIIQSLPNLQVLKLKEDAFKGSCWNTNEQDFPQLKLLRLEYLDIKVWKAYSASFPCLRQLEISCCKELKEMPLEIGEIPTLELIKIMFCRHSVAESVRRIEEEQHDLGNFDLKIHIVE